MVTFCPLFSGSSGNSAYLSCGDTSVLIDAGMSCKAVMTALAGIGADAGKLDAILVTHEHSDHIKGLPILTKRLKLPIYGSAEVLEYIETHQYAAPGTELVEISSPMDIGCFHITPFDTPHDSVHSLGYRFEMEGYKAVGVATDLGCVTQEVSDGLFGCDLVMLESNYDDSLLACSSYPYYLKRRIQSSRGHLSNEDCANYLSILARQGTSRFVLSHLSLENNMPEIAYQTVFGQILEDGMREEDFTLQVAKRFEPSPTLAF